MRRNKISWILVLSLGTILLLGCSKEQQHEEMPALQTSVAEAQITFIELGSVNCVPCKMMQPVMKSVDEKYGDQLRVLFYDVWTQEERHYAQEYGIRIIPTQIFLDENGEEIARHEGFYPEEELDKFLQSHGLAVESASQEL
ncbi:MAG: thioredoxin family protein [Candidatus Marinimicrobia bacterium]|nr:thioredoxin family protein [Candidatus Neomarinimicrobiota bacterium]MCF7839861.1 thioredoxin family protein [Candidatus Neomarinimicrobiota bacterium]MCF7903448.1 thioredoxin family protein [Candidatus Neomarinimicrobiota bacterium]